MRPRIWWLWQNMMICQIVWSLPHMYDDVDNVRNWEYKRRCIIIGHAIRHSLLLGERAFKLKRHYYSAYCTLHSLTCPDRSRIQQSRGPSPRWAHARHTSIQCEIVRALSPLKCCIQTCGHYVPLSSRYVKTMHIFIIFTIKLWLIV